MFPIAYLRSYKLPPTGYSLTTFQYTKTTTSRLSYRRHSVTTRQPPPQTAVLNSHVSIRYSTQQSYTTHWHCRSDIGDALPLVGHRPLLTGHCVLLVSYSTFINSYSLTPMPAFTACSSCAFQFVTGCTSIDQSPCVCSLSSIIVPASGFALFTASAHA